jgi:hypothetical protein
MRGRLRAVIESDQVVLYEAARAVDAHHALAGSEEAKNCSGAEGDRGRGRMGIMRAAALGS